MLSQFQRRLLNSTLQSNPGGQMKILRPVIMCHGPFCLWTYWFHAVSLGLHLEAENLSYKYHAWRLAIVQIPVHGTWLFVPEYAVGSLNPWKAWKAIMEVLKPKR